MPSSFRSNPPRSWTAPRARAPAVASSSSFRPSFDRAPGSGRASRSFMRYVTPRLPFAAMAVLLLVCALAPGCGSSSSSLEEQLQRLASTASGTTMLVEAWCDGSVPRTYAIHTVERAGQSLDRISGALTQTPAPSDRVQQALQEIEQLRQAIATTREALQREDRGAARSALGILRRLESEARQQTLAEASS